MDFVRRFSKGQRPEAVREPFEQGDEKIDAVLASVAESICDELKLPVPEWLSRIPACS